MQRIVHEPEYKSVHPIFDEIDLFFAETSKKDSNSNRLVKVAFDWSFELLSFYFKNFGGVDYGFEYDYKDYNQIDPIDNKNIILLFSGGKDSVASILKLQEQGYNVYLYYMKHINQSFPNEEDISKAIADYLGLPLYIDDIKFSGHHDWMEHPLKNIIIANGALQYGIREGIGTQIAVGNYRTQELRDESFHMCAGDTIDFWEAYNDIISHVIPDFSMNIVLENITETLETLEQRRDLLELAQSCLFPYRWRGQLIRQNEAKYNIKLMPNRCGSCPKCALEYIYYTDRNILEFNRDFYVHCLDVMNRQRNKENNPVPISTPEELWNDVFPMSMKFENSKLYNELKNGIIKKDKIKI